MAFHRLVVPTYFGGLPGGYDYINNAVTGVPANTDGALSFGPNIGSYFVSFGEDALSSAANRGLKALAQNTDAIDDSLHRDIAVTTNSGLLTSAGDKSYTAAIGTYLGAVGTVNTADGVAPYFQVVDSNGNTPVDASNAPIVVSGVSLTSPDTIGNGFSVHVVGVIFSSTIPTGVQYRVYYGVRSNLAALPADVLMRAQLVSTPHVTGYLENILENLHGPVPGGTHWDSSWTTSIYYLAESGLDERYRHSTSHSSGPPFWPFSEAVLDTAGAGAWFFRDGPGITGFSAQDISVLSAGPLSASGWLSGAVFGAVAKDIGRAPTFISSNTRAGGETTGFYFLGGRRFVSTTSEDTSDRIPGFASFFHGYAVEVGGSNATFSTWLPAGTTVTFDGSGIGSGASVSGPAFFGLAGTPITTSIACGYDLLELDFGDGLFRHFVITELLTPTKASLAHVDGSDPNFTNLGTATIKRWIRLGMAMFDDAVLYRRGIVGNSGGVLHGGFMVTDPPPMTSTNIIDGSLRPSAAFFASKQTLATKAVVWGGYDSSVLTYTAHGSLLADGSIASDGQATFAGQASFGGTISGGVDLSITGSATIGNHFSSFDATIRTFTRTSFVASISSRYTSLVASVTHDVTGNGTSLDIIDPSGTGTFVLTLTNLPATTSLPSFDSTEIRVHMQRTSGSLTTLGIVATDNLNNPVTVVWESGTLDATLTPGGGQDLYIGRLLRNKLYMTVQRL